MHRICAYQRKNPPLLGPFYRSNELLTSDQQHIYKGRRYSLMTEILFLCDPSEQYKDAPSLYFASSAFFFFSLLNIKWNMSTTAASSIHSPSSSQHSPTLTIASQPILLAPSNSLMLSLRPDKRKWQESFPDNSSKASKSPRHDRRSHWHIAPPLPNLTLSFRTLLRSFWRGCQIAKWW